MADLQLTTVLSSGEIGNIQLSGTTTEDRVLTKKEVDSIVASEFNNLTKIKFTPQSTLPAHQEGLLWYDNTRKALAYYDDVTSDPIHIGQEMLIHVYNESGATLTAGQVVRYSGVITNGLPSIVLAQADTIANAKAIGVVSTDMLDGTAGSIVTQGVLSGLDTSGLVQGERMYLSDTVAGGLTDTPGDIICLIGGSLESSATGNFFVNIENYQTLPIALANMSGGSAGASITTTWADITGYTAISDIIMTANPTTGEILAPVGGMYSVTANFVATFDDIGNNPQFVYLRILGDQGSSSASLPFSVARNGEGASMYPKLTVTLVADENYKLQVSASATITGVTYDYVSFELEAKRLVP